jgi:type I restriction enzyme M protein
MGGTKFKQEHRSIELVSEEADISLIVHDALPERKLDFMLAGPPYGKSWKKDREAIGGK